MEGTKYSPEFIGHKIEETKKLLRKANPVLDNLASAYLKERAKVNLCIGDLSYNQGSNITVALSEDEAVTLRNSEKFVILKFKTYHEASHKRFTDSGQYNTAVNKAVKIWADRIERETGSECNCKKNLFNLAYGLLNRLEDGRIENILCNLYPGLCNLRSWVRMRERLLAGVDGTENELILLLNEILTLSTMGMHVRDFHKFYPEGSDMDEFISSLIPYISGYVKSGTIERGTDDFLKIVEALSKYILDTPEDVPEKSPKVIDLPEEVKEMLRKELENTPNNNAAGGQGEDAGDKPLVAILTDDMKEEEGKEGKTPDYIIDLRKNPPKKPSKPEEGEDESQNGSESQSGSEGESGSESKSESQNGSLSEVEGESQSGSLNEAEGESQSGSSSKSEGESQSGSESGSEGENSSGSEGESESQSGNENSPKQGEADKGNRKENTDRKIFSEEELERELESIMEGLEVNLRDDAERMKREAEKYELSFNESESSSTKLSGGEIREIEKNLGFRPCYNKFNEVNTAKEIRITSDAEPSVKRRANVVAQKVRNILASKTTKARRGKTEGDVDVDRLARFVVGKDDVFKTPGKPFKLDACCFILKDDSGSMSGIKEKFAIQALSEIEEVFKPIMPLKITTFSTVKGGDQFKVIKDWDAKSPKNYSASYRMAGFNPSGGNNDPFAIANATYQLLKRKEKNKILIVVSDGLPDSIDNVKKAVKWARGKGIFLVSVFIGANQRDLDGNKQNYEYMYEKYCISTLPENMGSILVQFLKRYIKSL